MKKRIVMIAACLLLAALSLGACGSGKDYNTANPNSVENVLNNEGKTPTAAPADNQKTAVKASSADIDIDLTELSAQMIYAEVSNMFKTPDAYKGKTIRMTGDFSAAEYNGKTYYACIIRDAAACCANGIEFVWAGEHKASDYPAQGTQITVVGDFDTYMEENKMYVQLINAQLTF